MINELQDTEVTLTDLDAAVTALEAAATSSSNTAERAEDLIGAVADLRTLESHTNEVARRVTRVKHAIEARVSNLRTAA